jgi:radical SAM enzyme (TIGR01210 family)
MSDSDEPVITDRWIISQRGKKNIVDPFMPYAFLLEKEITAYGRIEDIATVFLTNRECPFHCLMCDLWKNTTDETVPPGAIPSQIEWALQKLPKANHIKLYNSGSFFDTKAIPQSDYPGIAAMISGFKTVIVENHPLLINDKCLYFRDMIKTDLQIAIGLETANPEILKTLNKRMTTDDFANAVRFLDVNGISVRAFILLQTPFLTESEGIYWAKRSIDFAFDSGAECCVIIPVRAGNGAMDRLQEEGSFISPAIESIEEVLEYGIKLNTGRVFADTWDLKIFSKCDKCFDKRFTRITQMNLKQQVLPEIECDCYL